MLEFRIKAISLLMEADVFVWTVAPSGFALRPCRYVSHAALPQLPLAPLANYKAATCALSY